MKRKSLALALAGLGVLGSTLSTHASEPGAVSNPFRKNVVTEMVGVIYQGIGAGDTIRMSAAAKARYASIDADKDGSLSRKELVDAIMDARFRLSLKSGGGSDAKVAMKVINIIDAQDGIVGGQIRVSGNMI